jgi:predicted enzyme related to lactoylglutathione lyase
MANNETPRGRFVWYELMTTDSAGAQAFYRKLLGWGTEAWQGGGYTMWTNQGQALGGVMGLPEEARKAGVPSHWLASISTPDLDGTIAQARQLGGQVRVPVTEMPQVGRWAVLADPQGATFTAYTPAGEPPSSGGPPRVGEMSWHELMTSTDPADALRFYQSLFGWEKMDEHDMGAPVGKYVIYGLGGEPFGGMFRMEGGPPPMFWLYARVPDARRGAELTRELGGQVMNGPMEVPGGDQIVQIQDPQGAVFALHQIAKA